MEKDKMLLTIQTPKETLFKGEAKLITIRTEEGYMGVMANHLPILAKLKTGNFKIQVHDQKDITGTINSGFFFFHSNEALILASQDVILNGKKDFNPFEVPEFKKD